MPSQMSGRDKRSSHTFISFLTLLHLGHPNSTDKNQPFELPRTDYPVLSVLVYRSAATTDATLDASELVGLADSVA